MNTQEKNTHLNNMLKMAEEYDQKKEDVFESVTVPGLEWMGGKQ